MSKSSYDIRINGVMPVDLLRNFYQIESVEPAGTILSAPCLDDAAIWALVAGLQAAGIELVELRRVTEPGSC